MNDDDRTVDADPSTLDRLRRAAKAADPDATVDIDPAGLRRLRQAAHDADSTPNPPAVGSQAWLDDMPTPPAGTPRFAAGSASPDTAAPTSPPPPDRPTGATPAPPAKRPAFALGELPHPGPRRAATSSSGDGERWRPPERSMQPVAEATTVDHAFKWRLATIALAVVAAALVAFMFFGNRGSSGEDGPANVVVTTVPVGGDLDPVVVQQGEGGAGG